MTGWAQEAFQVAQSITYTIGPPGECQQNPAPLTLPAGYAERAQAAAGLQMQRAGVRLGAVLDHALANGVVPTGVVVVPVTPTPTATSTGISTTAVGEH